MSEEFVKTDPSQGFVANLMAAVGLNTAFFILFLILRKCYPSFYLPKAYIMKNPQPVWVPSRKTGFLNWIPYVLHYPENKILQGPGGFDAVMYLRFLKISIIQMFGMSVFGLIVLLPVFSNGGNKNLPEDDPSFTRGLDIFSLSNISPGSTDNWVCLLSVFLFSGLSYYSLFHLYSGYIQLKNLRNKKDNSRTRTVMVQEIPSLFAQSDEAFFAFFEKLYGNKVLYAKVVPLIGHLEEKRKQRKKLIKAWTIAKDTLAETGKMGKIRTGKYPWGETVDALTYYETKIREIDTQITMQQNMNHKMTKTGFVTFDSVATAMQCAQTIHYSNPQQMVVRIAPSPKDIHWRWVTAPRVVIRLRGLIVYVILFVLFLFWSLPITFISAFSNLTTLSKIKGFDYIVSVVSLSPWLKGLVEGFLPSLALVVFLAILPYLIRWILGRRGYYLRSEKIRALANIYWLFLFLNLFLISVIAGSLFDILQELIDSPKNVISLLARSLPAQSVYFINYLALQSVVYPVFFLCRIDEILICKIKQKLFSTTIAQRREAEKPDPFEKFNFSVLYSREILVFCISLTYSSMSPLILPFATAYFAVAYFTLKYNYVYVFTPTYEGTKMTKLAFDRILLGIIVYQLTMIGIFALKLIASGSSIFALVAGTFFFRWWMAQKFSMSTQVVPLMECSQSVVQKDQLTIAKISQLEFKYMPPCLVPLNHPLQEVTIPIENLSVNRGSTFAEELDDLQKRFPMSPRPSPHSSTVEARDSLLSLDNNKKRRQKAKKKKEKKPLLIEDNSDYDSDSD